MASIFRDSPIGRCVRLASNKRFCSYPEDHENFELPEKYTGLDSPSQTNSDKPPLPPDASAKDFERLEFSSSSEKPPSDQPSPSDSVSDSNDYTVVDWYSNTDPENPKNYSAGKKAWVTILLLFYVVAVYISSSLYTASEPGLIQRFNVSEVVAALGLSLFVVGYGVGPLLFSPISEIPAVGRNLPYAISFLLFFILSIPTALVDNFAGLMILRFLQGFFGAPALATAGASLGDLYEPHMLPYVMLTWTGGSIFGPSLGPLIAGFAAQAEGWRWPLWEIVWISAPVLILVLLSLPETSTDNILYRRAERLRKLTGNPRIRCGAEIKRYHMTATQITFDALIKPWEINLKDPAVLFTTFYTALTYSIYYTFFESFPLVYQGIYGFRLGTLGLAFLPVLIGVIPAVTCYILYQYMYAGPRQAKMDKIPPEELLKPGLVATFFIPIGLFIFAWTSRPSVPWIASQIGIGVAMIGIYTIGQSMLSYLPFTYPTYAGSLFAANCLARSLIAAGAVLFGRPMFVQLGIPGGTCLLAGLAALCSAGIWALFYCGPALRRRSRFAGL